jgi:hypothetical protein
MIIIIPEAKENLEYIIRRFDGFLMHVASAVFVQREDGTYTVLKWRWGGLHKGEIITTDRLREAVSEALTYADPSYSEDTLE